MSVFGINYSLQSSRHTLDKVVDSCNGNIFPLRHHSICESIVVVKVLVVLSNADIDDVPKILDGVDIGALRGPWHNVDVIVFHLLSGTFCRVNRGVILLKNQARIAVILSNQSPCPWEVVLLQKLDIVLSIHVPIYAHNGRIPDQEKQPQNITFPPPNFMVGAMQSLWYFSLARRQTRCPLSAVCIANFDSSVKITYLQSG